MAVYYPLSASLALFANLVQNPEDPNAFEDLTLMQLVLMFLTDVMTFDKSIAAGRTFAIFQELHRTATAHVAKASAQSLPKERRKRSLYGRGLGANISDEINRQDPKAMNNIGPEVFAPVQSAQISAPGVRSALATAPSAEASASSLDGVTMTASQYIPFTDDSNFEWEIPNLWGWAEDYGNPSN